MSAAQPVPSATGAGDARPHEPSMEEILASIRRIIADDQSLAIVAAPEPAPVQRLHRDPEPQAPAAEPERPDPMAVHGAISAPQYPTPEPMAAAEAAPAHVAEAAPEVPLESSMPEPTLPEPTLPEPPQSEPQMAEPPQPEPEPEPLHPEPPHHEPAPAAAEAAEPYEPEPMSLDPVAPAPLFSSATHKSVTSAFNVLAASRLADNSEELLGMARDMIRPMLRAWLDENLPVMVERMVRDEIERVARGG